jgi:alkaline phosphatase D
MVETVRGKRDALLLSRRQALISSAVLAGAAACSRHTTPLSPEQPPYNAMGEKVGEVTERSAIVHTRLTLKPERNNLGYTFPINPHNLSRDEVRGIRIPEEMQITDLEGSCPGKAGRVRLVYAKDPSLTNPVRTEFAQVSATRDYTQQFQLKDLSPDTQYFYATEITSLRGAELRRGATGTFRTAPLRDRWKPLRFAVITCTDYACRDHLDGYETFRSIRRISPAFMVHTGDCVYYDIDIPFATSIELARFHWHRIYSQPGVVDVMRSIPCYWEKDDHDSFEDDCWPTRPPQRVNPMSYTDLVPVFREQVPLGENMYRSFRWGKGLEIWLVETRDFRSPNPDPDGPQKTIWGTPQREWLKNSLLASDAYFRVLISPDCIVGPGGDPDRATFRLPEGGADSHGDGGFAYEGREFRHWVRENKLINLIILNGDRHWQYHSIDPETGLNEFCCGAVAERHAASTIPDSPKYYHFVRRGSGFVSASLEGTSQQPRLVIRIHSPEGDTLHEEVFTG